MSDFKRAAQALSDVREIVVLKGCGNFCRKRHSTCRHSLTGIWARQDRQFSETAKVFRENPPNMWGW